jgi:hypothetical protein
MVAQVCVKETLRHDCHSKKPLATEPLHKILSVPDITLTESVAVCGTAAAKHTLNRLLLISHFTASPQQSRQIPLLQKQNAVHSLKK